MGRGLGGRMMKQCELCEQPARMFCESDQASLCWECDAKVHGANFLVARHCRRLLCRSCQAPTPWRASGSRLGSTVSVCNRCLGDRSSGVGDCSAEQEEMTRDDGRGGGGGEAGARRGGLMEGDLGGSGNMEEEEDDSEEDDNDDDDDDDEDEDGDNQVVPWSTEADETVTASPPPATSCSSSEESSSGRTSAYHGFLKRRREDVDFPSPHWQEDTGCSPSQHGYLRCSAAAASYPGRTPEEEEDEVHAPYPGPKDLTGAVRPRAEPANRSTPPRAGPSGASGTADDVFLLQPSDQVLSLEPPKHQRARIL